MPALLGTEERVVTADEVIVLVQIARRLLAFCCLHEVGSLHAESLAVP